MLVPCNPYARRIQETPAMLWVYIRIIGTRDNGKENGNCCIGVILGLYRDNTPIMENQMDKKMENKMKTGIVMDSILQDWVPHPKP